MKAFGLLAASFTLCLVAAVAACAPGDSDGAPRPAEEPPVPSLGDDVDDFPSARMIDAPWAETELQTPWGKQTIKVQIVDGQAVAEGDIVLGPLGVKSATSLGRYWPDGIVPYVIDGNLPQAQRVTLAMAHWEAKTKIRFRQRTTERDYVHFRPANGCSSNIGQSGGRQFVNLTTFESPLAVAAVAIDRSAGEHVYFYYKDGFATVGSPLVVNAERSHFRYTLPPAKSTMNLVEAAFAKNGHLFTFWDDGTYSEGSYADLALYAASKPFALAAGKTPADVTAIASDGEDRFHAFYTDGTVSSGTADDLAKLSAPQPFKVANGVTAADLGFADVGSDGAFQAYYIVRGPNPDGGSPLLRGMGNSVGTLQDLASATQSHMKGVRFPGHCSTGSTVHEIGHAVGLFHEQTRHDRDEYVKIMWENIDDSDRFNFEKHSFVVGTDTGPYDFNSIMHYGPTAFSNNGQPTIVAVDGRAFEEQRSGLSDGDLVGVRAMYPDL